MIAQRRNGEILISNKDMLNNYESFAMLNISNEDALEMLFASDTVVKTSEGFRIRYNDADVVNQMYKAIAHKHQQTNKNFIDVSKRYEMTDDDISGTSLLIRDSKNHTIKVCKRTSTNDNTCSINRLFITNKYRDMFFRDVQQCQRFAETKKYEMDARDYEIYSYWSDFMNYGYFQNIVDLKERGKI